MCTYTHLFSFIFAYLHGYIYLVSENTHASVSSQFSHCDS